MAPNKKGGGDDDEIPIRVAYNGIVLCMHVDSEVELEDLCEGIPVKINIHSNI